MRLHDARAETSDSTDGLFNPPVTHAAYHAAYGCTAVPYGYARTQDGADPQSTYTVYE